MTYIESLKSGNIAVWDPKTPALRELEATRHCRFMVNLMHKDIMKLHTQSDIYTVNAINQMIDSARDL